MCNKDLRYLSVIHLLVLAVFIFVAFRKSEVLATKNPKKSAITDLENFEQLKQIFKSDSGYVRLIVLLSPN
ncbi:MAG: hypothetical protein ACE5HX_06690 [bacterium]